jgi:hypothetical protein
MPADISFNTIGRKRVVEKAYQEDDTFGSPTQAVVNSAQQPFDPPIMSEDFLPLITIRRNERLTDFDPNVKLQYMNTINAVNVTIAGMHLAAYTAWMRRISPTRRWKANGDMYWDVTYEIVVDQATHYQRILDQGYFIISSGGVPTLYELEAIKDIEGVPVTAPALLDGTGARLAKGADAVYLNFLTLFPVSWKALNLPGSVSSER